MGNWEIDRILIWIDAGVVSSDNNPRKFYFDNEDLSFFNLTYEGLQYKLWYNNGAGLESYSLKDIKSLRGKQYKLKENDKSIIELPRIDKKVLEEIDEEILNSLSDKKLHYLAKDKKYKMISTFSMAFIDSLKVNIEQTKVIRPSYKKPRFGNF
jgi:predicted transcriptional regulator